MVDSMENPTCHINLPALRAAAMEVIYHSNVTKALRLISGKEKFVSWQDMLFDCSVKLVTIFFSVIEATKFFKTIIAVIIKARI